MNAERARATRESASASDAATQSIWILIVASLLAIAVGVLIAWGLSRAITRRLREAIATLTSSSAEILSATTQQASGIAEEEAAIQQTSTTADEVRQTAQLTNEKATSATSSLIMKRA